MTDAALDYAHDRIRALEQQQAPPPASRPDWRTRHKDHEVRVLPTRVPGVIRRECACGATIFAEGTVDG